MLFCGTFHYRGVPFSYLCIRKLTQTTSTMKVKLTREQIMELAKNPDTKVTVNDPWWVIVLKVVAYAIGLILAGMGTAQAATMVLPIL